MTVNDPTEVKHAPVLIDVSRLVWRAWVGHLPTGIDRTILAYLRHYGGRARAVVQRSGMTRVLSTQASGKLFQTLLEGGESVRGDLTRLAPSLLRGGEVEPGSIYLNVGHTGLDKPGHAEWVRRSGVNAFYFVHDLIPLTHPEYCRAGEPEKHRRRVEALLDLASGIIVNSRETLHELAAFAGDRYRRTLERSLVAPLGVGEGSVVASNSPPIALDCPWFVVIGTIEARKNHLLLLHAWAAMARRLGERCPKLVVIGQRGWECEQVVDLLERSEAIRGHVIELHRCDDVTLGAYVRGARALLFPSFVEGYGLPLVEALAEGTPVIASDLEVFRELAGDIPEYYDPIDGLGWSRAIEEFAAEESPMREAQIRRMRGWLAPSWKSHFEMVDRWLAEKAASELSLDAQ